jgi:stage II sporulation protein D
MGMRYLPFILLLLLMISPSEGQAEELVTVRLVNYIGDTSKLTFEMRGDYVSIDPTLAINEGIKYTLTKKNEELLLIGAGETQIIQGTLILIPRTYDHNHFMNINDRPYLGAVEFQLEDGEYIRPVNQLPLEDYLKGVVPFEVFPSWGIETLKAQVLAARTYAVSHLNSNMDDTIQYQVYGGYCWKPGTTKAVEATKGEVITHQGKLIDAFYSASNGGITESNANVWGGNPISYYPIKPDPYDPRHPWEFTLNQTQIELDDINWDNTSWWEEEKEKDDDITSAMKRWLGKHGYLGDIKILSVPEFELSQDRLDSKRALSGSIKIEFLQRLYDGTVLYQQLDLDEGKLNRIRPMIGSSTFKSYFVDSLESNNGIYTMKGKGFGHGVGMSQWGANIMGEDGKSYKEILQFYFPGTTITSVSDDKAR